MRQFRVVAGSVFLGLLVSGCSQPPPDRAAASETAAVPAQSQVERGKYLVSTLGCHDCHTPKKMTPNGPDFDMDRALSGQPEDFKNSPPYKPAPGSTWTVATNDHFTGWSGPWGVSYAANLTPDTNNGLRSGVWTEELFIKALRTGKHMGTSRPILPPMPWPVYGQLNDEDLKAVWAYLGTIKAINNHVPDPVPPPGQQ